MAKKNSRRPRRDTDQGESPAAPAVITAEPVRVTEGPVEKTTLEPPAPRDTNVQLAIIGMGIIGALMGGVSGYANWGMTVLAGVQGLVGGVAMGAAAGHSLLLPFRSQALVVIIMVTLAFGLFHWMGQTWNMAPMGLLVAGVCGLLLSLTLFAFERLLTVAVTLLHTNDMHDCRQALDRLGHVERIANTVLVDGGDSLRGSNTRWYWDEPIMGLMNTLGYQVQAMGNREFHYLRKVLAHRHRQRQFPILAANLEDVREGGRYWERTAVLEVAGFRIGFVGATPVQYDEKSPWQKIFGFRFHAPETILPAVIKELRSRCHVVVFMSHLGYAEDQRLAPFTPVDIIVGGHSHTVLNAPTWVGGVPIVQTGSHGRYLGQTTLRLSPAGALEGLEYELIPCRFPAESKPA